MRQINKSYKIESDLKQVGLLSDKIITELEDLGIPRGIIHDINLALREILVNAIKHGSKMNSNLFVDVIFNVYDDKIEIKIKDQGDGFDHQALPDPTTEENLNKLSGRGVFLVKKLMNEVEFSDGGSSVKMIKLLTR